MADGICDSLYSFVVNSMVCGYHQYKEIWPDPFVGEEFPCEQEVSNPHDPLVEDQWRKTQDCLACSAENISFVFSVCQARS